MDIRTASGIQANRPAPASAVPTALSAADSAARAPEPSTSQTAGQSASPASPSDPVVVAGGYISPVLRYDQGARLAVIHFRDRSSGETQNQIPAQQVVEEYRRTASRLGVRTDAAAPGEGGGTGRGMAASLGNAPPGGAGRTGTSGVGVVTASGAPPIGTPSMGTPSEAPAATGSPTAGGGTAGVGVTGGGVTGGGVTGAAPASGSYGAGSPGAIVSVTV